MPVAKECVVMLSSSHVLNLQDAPTEKPALIATRRAECTLTQQKVDVGIFANRFAANVLKLGFMVDVTNRVEDAYSADTSISSPSFFCLKFVD